MFGRQTLAIVAAAVLLPFVVGAQVPTFVVELEGGPAWQSKNIVEIPNDGTATRFSLVRLAGNGPWPAGRLYMTWNPARRHGIRLLIAPFSLTATGVPDRQLVVAGETYAAEQSTRVTYTFNSYRLSYRYRLHMAERTTAWVGFTAKIRDATVALEQGPRASRKDDVGFVPLLHVSGEWRFTPDWRLGLDADALAGGPGRAVDAALTLGYDLQDRCPFDWSAISLRSHTLWINLQFLPRRRRIYRSSLMTSRTAAFISSESFTSARCLFQASRIRV